MSRAPLALLLGAVAGVLAAMQPINDTDLFWHLATGREMLADGIVRTDVFSWTVRGAPISTDQWLGQVLMYATYLAADWRGIAILRVLSVVALVFLVARNVMHVRNRPLAAVVATLPALLLTRAVWVDRPELLGFVFFAALLVLLREGRGARPGEDGRTAALAAVVPLTAIWANVHGSFALGAVLALLVCAEGALRDVARRRVYIACAIGVVIATLLTPAGVGTWTAPGAHFFSPPRDIQEWGVIDVRTPLGIAYVATLALVVACALRGPRVDLRELAILIPVTFLSLTAARQAPLLAIAAAPLFADRFARLQARATETLSTGRTPSLDRDGVPRPAGSLGRAGLLLASCALLVGALAIAPSAPDERAYPVGALTSIPKGDGTLARYEWGGWLIWRAPATPVFVDGRLTPYAGGVLDDYRRIVAAAPGWEDALARRGVRTLLVAPSDPVAVRAQERGWRVVATSSEFILIAVP